VLEGDDHQRDHSHDLPQASHPKSKYHSRAGVRDREIDVH
jgi:hypothetical protein